MSAVPKTSSQPQEKVTSYPPMLLQYIEYKEKYNDCLILFQVGDFYELFFDDAKVAARTLNLTLTSRDKSSADPVPMCGVPISVIDMYAERLVGAGHSVALISQVSEGEAVTKGGVPRKLERIITPGVRILSTTNAEHTNSILASVYGESLDNLAIAFSDVQWGKVYVREGFPLSDLQSEISKINPSEILFPKDLAGKNLDRRVSWIREIESSINTDIKWRGESYIRDTRFDDITGLLTLSPSGRKAVRLLLGFIDETTVDIKASINEITLRDYNDTLSIDSTTRNNLELLRTIRDGTERGSLFGHMNYTQTALGSKKLASWIINPLTSKSKIEQRLEAVRLFIKANDVRSSLRSLLAGMPDLERIASRISLNVIGPKELGALRDTLEKLPKAQQLLLYIESIGTSDLISVLSRDLNSRDELLTKLQDFLVENPPINLTEGGVVKTGYDEEIDRLRTLKDSGKSWISEFETSERKRTGITSLKVRYNHVLGFYIEVTSANADKVPSEYVRRQSTANAERFFLPSLKEMEEQVLGAQGKQILLEKNSYNEFIKSIIQFVPSIRTLADRLSTIDVLLSLAELADIEGYVEPKITENTQLNIIEGKHPILSSYLKHEFVPNSVDFNDEKKAFVITGPNMGGKSTYLRQTALIVIMAQLGSFVPAKEATVGIIDKIFARIGASDDMHEGESTFMVEMREASFIISQSTPKSLVLIDEIGRGTATADGLSIARSILEWLILKTECRTLFATHFHELTTFSEEFKSVGNLSVGSIEKDEQVIFTHQIKDGPANKSYGIEVAKLAGLPFTLLARAKEILEQSKNTSSQQISLFSKPDFSGPKLQAGEVIVDKKRLDRLSSIEMELKDISINETTPMEALRILEKVKKIN